MALALIPDFERAVADYLRAQDSITALGARVRGTHPGEEERDTPWVLVTRLDARPGADDSADHLISALMQFDCYAGEGDGQGDGGGQPESNLLGRTVRAALGGIASYSGDGAVFSGCRITGDARIPDDAGFKPPRSRTILTALVFGHATAEVGS